MVAKSLVNFLNTVNNECFRTFTQNNKRGHHNGIVKIGIITEKLAFVTTTSCHIFSMVVPLLNMDMGKLTLNTHSAKSNF